MKDAEILAEVYSDEPERAITPQGRPCIKVNAGLEKILDGQARGSYQRAVVRELARSGYVVGYLAQGGALRGKAASYNGKYEISLRHLMNRIEDHLPGRYHIESGATGEKGGFGYWLSDEV